MTDVTNRIYEVIDEEHGDKPAATRRQLVAGAAAALGSMGLLGAADAMAAKPGFTSDANDTAMIANVAATAEVLATIVNTVGPEKVELDQVTRANVRAAAREELIHYQVLTSDAVGGSPITKRIWVPDAVFSSKEQFLTTLVVGDQIFINAYLLGLTVFARGGGLRGSQFARYLAEFMGTEGVHRALALQSLGRVGNDRAFMRFATREEAPGLPSTGRPGFYRIGEAVEYLEAAGFGFGKEGKGPGQFYDFDEVSRRTPDPDVVNTRAIS
ncbi:MAG TPA: hypothetical protein VGR12_04620 [Solirubrobacteraceae bacterium]|nr:hypothetical protein [Solirubrobacteraceae bacterium]